MKTVIVLLFDETTQSDNPLLLPYLTGRSQDLPEGWLAPRSLIRHLNCGAKWFSRLWTE